LVGDSLAWLLSIGAGAALLTHVTVRDAWAGVDVVFYATPIVLVAAAVWAAALLWFRCGRRRMAAVFAVLGLVLLGVWHARTYCRQTSPDPASPSSRTVRVVAWNLAHRALGDAGVFAQLRELNADVMILAEAGRREDPPDFWKQRFPEYAASAERFGLVVLARGDVRTIAADPLGHEAKFNHCYVDVGSFGFHVVQPEVCPSPLVPRGPGMASLWQVVEPLLDEPLIVAGDFNLPADSVFFDTYRRTMANAFEAAGTGYDLTWPVPVPVMALDHAWVSPRLHVRRCEIPWTWRSDHRPVVLEIEMK
jgi:endonuclease/exonuclease/phosphatase (EEP) superfamily protein YafD